ncbi:MAG: hypothetical protein U0263_34085 [Polyangiaceae bacterium]
MSPEIPGLNPTWMTWVWVGFALAVVVLTVLGFLYAGARYL